MKVIGILGPKSLLGQHLIFFLTSQYPSYKIIQAHRDIFKDEKKLKNFFKRSDYLFWFSWKNRGKSKELIIENNTMTNAVCKAIKSCEPNEAPVVVFTSSIHEDLNNAYGKTKKYAAQKLKRLQQQNNSLEIFSERLPNIFGEFGKPNHNSVVSTFCFNIVNKKPLNIIEDKTISLAYAQDTVEYLFKIAAKKPAKLKSFNITISQLKKKIEMMWDLYSTSNTFPRLSSKADIQIFNTIRSYIKPQKLQKKYNLNSDQRGDLSELTKSHGMSQTFFSITKPGFVRGNHFHSKKIERFIMIDGNYEIKIRKINSKKVYKFRRNKNEICFIDMPTFYTHNITNISKNKDLQALFWANEIFDEHSPDTYFMEVE
jgi:UDP-2-acetamido-2,6-beta-L-arabino-hexul-4-ose reductase